MPIDTNSHKEHDIHYVSAGIEDIKWENEEKTIDQVQFNPDQPLGSMMRLHKATLNVAVDVGSGHGWTSELLSKDFSKVYAIEPSEHASSLCKQLYPQIDSIEWICGFAEDELGKLELKEPALFVTSCVFSHLNDDAVVDICKAIDLLALEGSAITMSENWSLYGKDFAQKLWYSRTQKWWKARFPGWELDFKTEPTKDQLGSFKGITGLKI